MCVCQLRAYPLSQPRHLRLCKCNSGLGIVWARLSHRCTGKCATLYACTGDGSFYVGSGYSLCVCMCVLLLSQLACMYLCVYVCGASLQVAFVPGSLDWLARCSVPLTLLSTGMWLHGRRQLLNSQQLRTVSATHTHTHTPNSENTHRYSASCVAK